MDLLQEALALQDEIQAIRRAIHANPETGHKEFATTKLVESKLQAWNIETDRLGMATGVVGILRGASLGKTIGLRADMDALPMQEETGLPFASKAEGVSHSCGHDMHVAWLLGCAKMLSERREQLRGNVKFIFQPAEETLGGALAMVQNGVLTKDPAVDFIVGAHTWPDLPVGTIGLKKGPLFAGSDRFHITITGSGAHAAYPHRAVDPIMTAAYLITELQTIVSRHISPLDPAVVTIGKISGGTAANIIPDSVVLEGISRALTPEIIAQIRIALERVVIHGAETMGAKADIHYVSGSAPVISDDYLIDIIREAGAETLGSEKIHTLQNPTMGAEDFADYLEHVPGAYFRVGTGNDNPASHLPLHNAKIIFDEQALATAAAVLTGFILRILG